MAFVSFKVKERVNKATVRNETAKENQVCFNEHCFVVELARTPTERAEGLMFREKMDKNRGVLFIFDSEELSSFWMKNTLIPLDIIWINENKEVVFLKENFLPCLEENCETVSSTEKARYVLEINAGIAKEIGLALGAKLIFKID
jgi:hypothetical protein